MEPTNTKHGIDLTNINTEINPKDDFYEFACGGWIKKNPLTDEYSSFGTFDVLRENSKEQVKELVFNLSNDPESKTDGTIAQKISDLYDMAMDEEKLTKEGINPLLPILSELKEKVRANDLTDLISWLHVTGLDSAFFSSGVGADPADSNMNILHLGEAGLTLGDRDYYLEDSEENRKIMDAFLTYVKQIMRLAGYSDEEAERVWETVIKIEKELAAHKMTREDRRNPLLHHNIFSIQDLKSQFEFIDWDRYFGNLNLENVESLNIGSVDFLKFINRYVRELTTQEIEDYLVYSVITNSTGVLGDDFEKADFELFGKVMSGQKERKPRWKRVLGLLNSMFGEAIGQLYVAKYFPEANKTYMLELVENLRRSLKKHIETVEWMSDETKAKALDKLKAMTVKIGYPDKWKDYSEIHIDKEASFLENVQKASEWFVKDNYSKFNKPVDKTEWHMNPQTVNAYYSPVVNEICFPAGILQPPYFDITADDALNYGAIGVIIGHEMTHGFDDQGRQFDKNGNLKEWWNKSDADKFNALADKLAEQFNKIEILPGLFANGRYTLGENIADQGGLNVALTAYKDIATNSDDIDGFTPLQRFFLSYAGVWAGSMTDEAKSLRTKTDPHSIGKNRVNATLKNLDEFNEAFSISSADKMYMPVEERVLIW